MASTRQTSRSHIKASNAAFPSPAKKFKPDSSFQVSPNSSEDVVDAADSSKSAYPDSDSSLVETVEVEEVDVTEEYVVSMDETSIIYEEDHSSSQELNPLQMVQTSISVPGGDLVEESTSVEKTGPSFVFKDPNFIHSSKGPGGNKKTRIWKNLKQITTAERAMFKDKECVTYGSIDAPPSFRPAKKYSDISGLEAKYTDPQTKLRYTNAEEFQRVRILPGDIVSGCLTLRKANTLVP